MEDLRTHQRMECGKGDYRDDDNLSISGDEDVSTLNDVAGIGSAEQTCVFFKLKQSYPLTRSCSSFLYFTWNSYLFYALQWTN